MSKNESKKMWGGRFKKKIDADFEDFSKSIQYDCKLAKYDIYHSHIHVRALEKSGILTRDESKKVISALNEILEELKSNKLKLDPEAEDIHTAIQNCLQKRIGKLALKIHTSRSRNDQIVFDEKCFCSDNAIAVVESLITLLRGLQTLIDKHRKLLFVGYTHTQRAQVILFADYLEAFLNMFLRDAERMQRFIPLVTAHIGAGALTGSALKRKDYEQAIKDFLKDKKDMPIIRPVDNPLDNVASRDFIIEFLSILSIIQMHLSRMAEDFILYSTKEFSFFDLPEEFCTGSSLMPHKKNPDFLELVRGYTGRIYGNLISVLTTLKGLPLTYNRDMQLDKEPLFSSVQILKDELKIMAKLIKGIKINKNRIHKALEDENLYATELVEFLAFKGVVFRDAHDIVGELIKYCEDKKMKIKEMPDKLLKNFHPQLSHKEIEKIISPKYAISSKKSLAALSVRQAARQRKASKKFVKMRG